ncbi:MAG: hypothetical protein KAJ66_00325 [Candidatus Omnitrophica bacterium]|nr:hypothetical protein [Candidatus Omnitrophota bacterium]
MKRLITRIILASLISTAIIVFSILIWINLPLDNYDARIDFSKHWLFMGCDIAAKDASLIDEVVNLKFKNEYIVNAWWRRRIIKFVSGRLLPLRINFYLDPVDNGKDFVYTIAIQSSKVQRACQIYILGWKKTPYFKKNYRMQCKNGWQLIKPANSSTEKRSLASFKDLLVFSNDIEGFEAAIDDLSLKAAKIEVRPCYTIHAQVTDDIGMLNHYVDKIKDDASYDLFPTISDISRVKLYLNYDNEKSVHKGCISFKVADNCNVSKVKRDIRFLMQFFKRVADANGYKIENRMEVDKNAILAKFNVSKN